MAILAFLPFWIFCGGGSGGGGNPPPTASSVIVTPPSLSLNKGGSQAFTATVNGTSDQSVFWEIDEAVPKSGDSTHGAISTGGVYIAPATVPTPATVTIRALSAGDPTKSCTATQALQAG